MSEHEHFWSSIYQHHEGDLVSLRLTCECGAYDVPRSATMDGRGGIFVTDGKQVLRFADGKIEHYEPVATLPKDA